MLAMQLALGLACGLTIPILVGWVLTNTGGMWIRGEKPEDTQPNPILQGFGVLGGSAYIGQYALTSRWLW